MLPAILAPVFSIVGTIIDRLIPDTAAAEKAKLEMAVALQGQEFQIQLEQIKTNAVEAQSPSIWVSGARPAVMWICALALGYCSIFEPIMRFTASVGFHYLGAFPVIDTELTMQLLIGLLGLGGYRTVEKIKGVASK